MRENILKNKDYYHFLVQYQGNIEEEFQSYPMYFIQIISDRYAILSIPREDLKIIDDGPPFSTIVYIKPSAMYTLQQISPLDASQADFLQLENLPLNLTGKGVTVAVIDTGLDYLNEEFMDRNGISRIDLIWDQTIDSDKKYENMKIPFGTIYSNAEIQSAIDERKKGNDPYSIVPSKDEYGHGTKMAGLIGATGKNPDLKGVVPDCRFISIKLIEDISYKQIFRATVPVFNIGVLFAALEFLYEYSLRSESPLVIYIPLGSNLGNHNGNSILDQFIDFISINADIIIVTATGNEGMSGSHASGEISEEEITKVIDLDVPPEVKNIWIIRLRFYDLQPGIWKLRLSGDLILDASFNIWIPQQGLIHPNTRLSPANTYGTLTNPGNSSFTATIAAYNQSNNNILNYSGLAFSNNFVNTIDVAAGGVNALTVAPNNTTDIVNGTSVASAIAAGLCYFNGQL